MIRAALVLNGPKVHISSIASTFINTSTGRVCLICPDHFPDNPDAVAAQIEERYFEIRYPQSEEGAFVPTISMKKQY
ncbi:MAG TPA: hypothetical protein DDZ40_02445 [Deltaproteobacteria bacterium]|nr:hypothetical protein [Deltaproteobacteria bacterium]